jgi:hypothetical protein
MVDLEKMVKMCIVYALCLFYSAQVVFGIIVLFFTKSHLRFWVVKKRQIPPKCLQNPELGEHKYVSVNVSFYFEKSVIIYINFLFNSCESQIIKHPLHVF